MILGMVRRFGKVEDHKSSTEVFTYTVESINNHVKIESS